MVKQLWRVMSCLFMETCITLFIDFIKICNNILDCAVSCIF